MLDYYSLIIFYYFLRLAYDFYYLLLIYRLVCFGPYLTKSANDGCGYL